MMPYSSYAKVIVFTDLDGTLLDDQTYSADSSLPALRELQARYIPIVFCSSKTRQEQEVIRTVLDVRDPFIVENGSAIIVPEHTITIAQECITERDGTKILVLGVPVEIIRNTLKQVTTITGLAYRSFQDLTAQAIAHLTGLDLESAKLAKAREYSETIVTEFSPSELSIFIEACEAHGLCGTLGGRFLSVTGRGADKGKAVKLLTKYYRLNFGDIVTLGIGDSPNDAPMLRNVDFPYLVQRPNGQWRAIAVPKLNLIPAVGPLGFVEMVNDIKR